MIPSLNLTVEQFSELMAANPSLRGMCTGYAMEVHARERLLNEPGVQAVTKITDHDRESRFDLLVEHEGYDMRVEVKLIRESGQVHTAGYENPLYEESFRTYDTPRDRYDVLCMAKIDEDGSFFLKFVDVKDIPPSTCSHIPEEKRDRFLKSRFHYQQVVSYDNLCDLCEAAEVADRAD